jgi:hypothetical protein
VFRADVQPKMSVSLRIKEALAFDGAFAAAGFVELRS